MSINYIGMGLGFGWKLGGTSAPVIGPTWTISNGTATLSLTVGDTGTLPAATPKDHNGTPTGATHYWVSSNEAKATINKTTRAYAALATGACHFYAQMVDPSPDSESDTVVTYDPALHDILFQVTESEMDSYANWAAFHTAKGVTSGNVADHTSDDDGSNQILAEGGHNFTAVEYFGVDNSGGFGNEGRALTFVPSGVGDGGRPGQTLYIQFECRWTERGVSLTDGGTTHLLAMKNLQWFPTDAQGSRPEASSQFLPAGRGTNHIPYTPSTTPAYDPTKAFPLIWIYANAGSNTEYNAVQCSGPFLNEMVGSWFTHKMEYKTHTPNDGTVDFTLRTAVLTFATDQTGELADGDYITVDGCGSAEFLISDFVAANGAGYDPGKSTATVTRSGTTGHPTFKTYSGGLHNKYGVMTPTFDAIFSAPQADEPTCVAGGMLRVKSWAQFNQPAGAPAVVIYPLIIDSFNGTTGAVLSMPYPNLQGASAGLNRDYTGVIYSTILDGRIMVWFNDFLVVASSRAHVGVVNPRDVSESGQEFCTMLDAATIHVNDGTSQITFAGVQQRTTLPARIDYKNILVFKKKL